MSQWGAENFRVTGLSFQDQKSLEAACRALNSKTKQAFYAAASAQKIKRGTWNGCAFNAGSQELGQDSKSVAEAARVFGCSHAVVRNFINVWDSTPGTDEDATTFLRETLENVGLFCEPGSEVRVVSYTVWKSEQTELLEAFQKELENDFVPEGFAEAVELLGCSA